MTWSVDGVFQMKTWLCHGGHIRLDVIKIVHVEVVYCRVHRLDALTRLCAPFTLFWLRLVESLHQNTFRSQLHASEDVFGRLYSSSSSICPQSNLHHVDVSEICTLTNEPKPCGTQLTKRKKGKPQNKTSAKHPCLPAASRARAVELLPRGAASWNRKEHRWTCDQSCQQRSKETQRRRM